MNSKFPRAGWLAIAVALVLLGGCEKAPAPVPAPHAEKPSPTPPPGWIDAARLSRINTEPGAWLTGGRDQQQSYHSPLQQINKDNVSRLGFAWQYEIDTEHGFEATPIVVDRVMYASGPGGAVYAVHAGTGAEVWKFEPEVDADFMRKACCGVVNRGVAVWRGMVYVGSLDGYLYALNAADGSVAWKVDTITDRERGYTMTGAPYIAKDLVIIGNAGAEFDARGYITAYDHATGEQRWRFFTVPGDPKLGFEHPELAMAAQTWDPDSLWEVGLGGTVWDAMAYDPELNLLYVGTGNAAPYPRKLRSPAGGDNLFLASILAINPDDGHMVWHYQTTPADNWDFTATMKMILADLEIDGKTRQVIMQAPKNGFFYVLDRLSGELISAEPYVTITWASHVDKQTGKPVETGQGEYFHGPKLVFPSPAGGHNWQPMAFNPATGLVYIPVIEASTIWVMPEEPFEYQKGGLNSTSIYIFPMRGEWGLDGAAAKKLPPLAELAHGQPDTTIRGFVKAWDPVAQKLAWEVETSGQWVGELFATWNGGGLMTSAGGLVFQGRGSGEFVALDAATGEQLHSIDTGTSMMAGPMTYTVGGEQYVAIMAGLGGAAGQEYVPGTAAYKYGNKGRIIAFKLGGGAVPKRPEVEHVIADVPMPPVARRGTPEQVELGADLYVRNCTKCHSNMDGRSSGIPDLGRLSAEAHRDYDDVMLKGTLAGKGMGSFAGLLSPGEIEAIHDYLIDLAWQNYETAQAAGQLRQTTAPHTPKADKKPEETIPYGDNPQAGHYVDVNGIALYFETYGNGKPLLLIHGNGQSIAALRFQIAHFAQSYQVIVADSRGHGKSGLGTDHLVYMQMMEDYNALLEHLNVSKANIIGWSDGGILSLLLAIHHPDKANKMAIMGANLRPDETAINSWTRELLEPFSKTVDEMIRNKDTTADWPLNRQLLDLLMTQPDIPVESLHQIEAPVLVMAGDKDIIRSAHTVEIFDNLPQAHLAILPGQTHWAPQTDPVGFNALVEKFFAAPYTRPESREILARELGSAD